MAVRRGNETEYASGEFARSAQALFGASPELVMAALRLGGKDRYTRDEAGRLVREFMNRRVNQNVGNVQ